MRHLISKTIVLGAVLSSTLVGCAAQTGSDAPSQGQAHMSIDSACSTLCARDLACDSSTDKSVCVDKCTNSNAVAMPKLRSDLVSATVACYQAKDCATVVDGKAWKECVSTSEATLAPSAAAQTFCADLVDVATKCQATADQGACLDSAKIFNDAALKDATSCTRKACSEVNDCIRAALP